MNPSVTGAFKSKTMWVAFLILISSGLQPIWPQIGAALHLDPKTWALVGTIAALFMAALRTVTNGSLADKATAPTPPVIPPAAAPLLLLAMLLPTVLFMSGCKNATAFLASPTGAAVVADAGKVVDSAVAIATTYELTKDPSTTKAKAVAFKAIAQQIVADTANPTTTVATLEATLTARIAALSPNPVIAASAVSLAGGIQGALNNVIGTSVGGPLAQTTLVDLGALAQQVVTVCTFYGA
jgi:hypothetical protein